jgi:NO-binding membrane sensor protein with MHYT domain
MHAIETSTLSWLLLLSALTFLTAIVACHVGFSFALQPLPAATRLTGGSLSLGIGVWSAYYLSVLARPLPAQVAFHLPTVLLALVPAVLGSAGMLALATLRPLTPRRTLLAGLVFAGGTFGTHRLGVHSIRHVLLHTYVHGAVAVATVLSAALAMAALWIVMRPARSRRQVEANQIRAALILGLGIALLQAAGQAVVTYVPVAWASVALPRLGIPSGELIAILCVLGLILVDLLRSAIQSRTIERRAQRNRSQIRVLPPVETIVPQPTPASRVVSIDQFKRQSTPSHHRAG